MTSTLTDFARLQVIAHEIRDDSAVADLETLERRVDEGRFFVACIGQFKRGKSTLLNALVGAPLLPVGVTPVTAVITILRHGAATRARVSTRARGWFDVRIDELAEYVSEERNKNNAKEVTAVEVSTPSPLLASGMCLVDTPGLGSVFASNTEATRAFVPHIDAALVVLGADPPIGGEELALVGDIARNVEHLIFVINKADRLSEGDVAQARTFTRDVLTEHIGSAGNHVLVVSAAERLAGTRSRDWNALENRLQALAHNAGADLVEGARRRGLERIAKQLARAIDEHRGALLRPLDESARRLETLTLAVAAAERSVSDLEPLFRAEEESLRQALEARREAFLADANARAAIELRARVERSGDSLRALRTKAFGFAQEITHEEIEAWAKEVRPAVEELYRRSTARFVMLGNDLLQRIRRDGDAFDGLPTDIEPEAGLRVRSQFYYTELLATASPGLSALLSPFQTRKQALRSIHKRAAPYLVRLLDRNSSRIIYDLVERVRESGTRLRGELVRMLRTVTVTAKQSIERASQSRARGESAVRAELIQLDALRKELPQ